MRIFTHQNFLGVEKGGNDETKTTFKKRSGGLFAYILKNAQLRTKQFLEI